MKNNSICQTRRVDRLGRIVIPKEICKEADIHVNELMRISFDSERKKIIMTKNEDFNFIEFVSNHVLKSIYETLNIDIIITNNEKIFKILCKEDKNLRKIVEKDISQELKEIINHNKNINVLDKEIKITNNYQLNQNGYYFIIKEDSFPIGCAFLITSKKLNEDLLNFIASQLSK